jgi:hypothetical protein
VSPATGPATGPATVAVAGSCVTRDNFNSTFNPDYKSWFQVVVSSNQTSMIALMSPPIDVEWQPLQEMSDYDRWNVGDDLTRQFLVDVAAQQPRFLILDWFGDVHFGVARLPDGRYFTDNRWKVAHTDFYRDRLEAGELTRLNRIDDTEEYFALWAESLDRFAAQMAETCPDTRIVVHRGWNTDRVLVPGRPRAIPLRKHTRLFPLDIAATNAFWARLDDHAVSTYGWDEIDLRGLQAPTYAAHPWGAFYVHYTPDYYHRFLAELLKLSLRDRLDAGTLTQVGLIEAAAAEPAQRRLEVEEAATRAQAARLEESRDRVAELESLGLARSVKFALGQRVRARAGRKSS